jgi:hypothetical protein
MTVASCVSFSIATTPPRRDSVQAHHAVYFAPPQGRRGVGKTIIVRSAEIVGGQRDLYATVRSAMDAKVLEAIAQKGFARSQIVILDALLKLRQVCCDPRLLKSAGAQKVKERAKLDLLMDMLPELLDEGRKVLLFSSSPRCSP